MEEKEKEERTLKLSVLTVPLSDMSLKDTLAFLKNKGVQAFELPSGGFPGKAHCNPEEILKDEKAFLELKETIQGFSPRAIIFGHENEMGHSIDHREAFWLTQHKLDTMALPVPGIILCWGEGYRYKR